MRPKLKWWRDSIKIKAQKIVSEMVEEQKQKEVVKQKELQGLHNRDGATLEDTKEQKQHLSEENEIEARPTLSEDSTLKTTRQCLCVARSSAS